MPGPVRRQCSIGIWVFTLSTPRSLHRPGGFFPGFFGARFVRSRLLGHLGRRTARSNDRALRSPVTSHCPINMPLSQLPSSPYMRRAAVPVIQRHAQDSGAFTQPAVCSNEGVSGGRTHLHFSFAPLHFMTEAEFRRHSSGAPTRSKRGNPLAMIIHSRPCQLIEHARIFRHPPPGAVI